MSKIYFFLLVTYFVINLTLAQENRVRIKDIKPTDEHYPLKWAQIDAKPVIDNERLFKKYKECFLMEKPVGCPRDVTDMRSKD